MIELYGGLDDFAGQLRRLFGARGAVTPIGADSIQPVVTVGPELASPWGVGTPFTLNYNASIAAAGQTSVQVMGVTGAGFIAKLHRMYIEYEPVTVTPIVTMTHCQAEQVFSTWPVNWVAQEVGGTGFGRVRGLGSDFLNLTATNLIRRGYQRVMEHVFEDFTCYAGNGIQLTLQNLDGGPRLANCTILGTVYPFSR